MGALVMLLVVMRCISWLSLVPGESRRLVLTASIHTAPGFVNSTTLPSSQCIRSRWKPTITGFTAINLFSLLHLVFGFGNNSLAPSSSPRNAPSGMYETNSPPSLSAELRLAQPPRLHTDETQPRHHKSLRGHGGHGSQLLGPSPRGGGPSPPSPTHGHLHFKPIVQSPWARFWQRNKPAALVALSQLFNALTNLNARILELDGNGLHPVQCLLVRQGLMSMCCLAYMRCIKVPGYPFGQENVRWLLLARGLSGFSGALGMWYSMMYLPLADATVITFLAPGVAGLMCYFALREPFTRVEQLATVVALLGVVLIAQPGALWFSDSTSSADRGSHPAGQRPEQGLSGARREAAAQQRLMAVGVALLGVLGTAGAFATLRAIGKHAHPLISVNYFGAICTLICLVTLAAAPALDIGQPSLRWIAPASAKQWFLLLTLGISGFVMQFLLTAGLAADKSNRANAMVYTHMLFAVAFDRWVFGHRMGLVSFLGCVLILGSAVGVVFVRKPPLRPGAGDVEGQDGLAGEAEASPILVGASGNTEGVGLDMAREEPASRTRS